MTIQRKFSCRKFIPDSDCKFEVAGDEETVINEALVHVVEEHGYQDSPILREQIRDSLDLA